MQKFGSIFISRICPTKNNMPRNLTQVTGKGSPTVFSGNLLLHSMQSCNFTIRQQGKLLQISQSPNNWITEVGGHLWQSSISNPQLQAPWYGCSGPYPNVFWLPPRMKPLQLSGQPVPVFRHPCSKKCFPMFKGNSLYFSLYPLCHVTSAGTLRRVWLHPLCSLHQVFIYFTIGFS